MRFLFIDAENTGNKEVEEISATVADKVFVFSKNEKLKLACERKFFLYISSYPTGKNQADFYIIGNLVGIFASLTDEQRDACQFVLYSQDEPLLMAFSFQCQLHKVKYKIALEPKDKEQPKITQQNFEQSIEKKVYNQFKTAKTTEVARKNLKQPKAYFIKVFKKRSFVRRAHECHFAPGNQPQNR